MQWREYQHCWIENVFGYDGRLDTSSFFCMICMFCSCAFVFAAPASGYAEFGAGPTSNQVQVHGYCTVFGVFLFAMHKWHEKRN